MDEDAKVRGIGSPACVFHGLGPHFVVWKSEDVYVDEIYFEVQIANSRKVSEAGKSKVRSMRAFFKPNWLKCLKSTCQINTFWGALFNKIIQGSEKEQKEKENNKWGKSGSNR